jgi:hypothetical protein
LAFACLVVKDKTQVFLAATLKRLAFVDSHNADGAREKLKNLSPVAVGFYLAIAPPGLNAICFAYKYLCPSGAGYWSKQAPLSFCREGGVSAIYLSNTQGIYYGLKNFT